MSSVDNTCERCRVALAHVWFWRVTDQREWQFCGNHANRYAPALEELGYVIAKDTRDTLATNRLQGAL
jgi:hypothetical protein